MMININKVYNDGNIAKRVKKVAVHFNVNSYLFFISF